MCDRNVRSLGEFISQGCHLHGIKSVDGNGVIKGRLGANFE